MSVAVIAAILLASSLAGAQGDLEIPDAARPFVAAGTQPLAFEVADLNRDGRPDAILVLEPTLKPGDDEFAERPRPLLILIGEPAGGYREAARNLKVVYCSSCGGMMGDPFQGVTVGPGTFTVENAGGSAWRWGVAYRFDYSRRDDTWQLVRVVASNYHVSEPNGPKATVSTPPKDFGKIDIADFDPEHWKNQGAR